ncbi:MAG: transporter [Paludibacteraceae bacterium]|nr:transporter [Paludibacteraceae bacterium]
MISNKFITTTLALFLGTSIYAQEVETQETIDFSADRPGASTGTDITGKYKLMFETGFGFERDRYEGADSKTYTLNTSLLRFGLSDNAELRFQIDEQTQEEDGESVSGICPMIVGSKLKIFDGYKAIPKIGLLCNLVLPTGKSEFKSDYVSPQIYLLFDNELTDKLSLGYNVGGEWDGNTANATTFAAICLGYSITDKFGAFIENYDYFHSEHKPVWLTEFGVSWQVAPRVQVDLAGDLNLKCPDKNYAISFGLAWLIN